MYLKQTALSMFRQKKATVQVSLRIVFRKLLASFSNYEEQSFTLTSVPGFQDIS